MYDLFKSDKYKFLFVHIPKTGGTSIKAALNPYTEKSQLSFNGEQVTDLNGYRPHKPLTKKIAEKYAIYHKVVCVRNSWSWHSSIYNFTQKRKMKGFFGLTFDQYINQVCSGENRYSKNQFEYFTENGQKLVNQVIRFNHLEKDFQEMCSSCGLGKIELGHFKNAGEYDYREMYTEKTKNMIAIHCKKDIEMFGWKF